MKTTTQDLGAPRYGIDIDGVLADFISHFIAYAASVGKAHLFPSSLDEWVTYDGGASEDFRALYAEIAGMPSFWREIERLPNSLDLQILPTPTIYLTARPIPSAITEAWLEANGFPKATVITVNQSSEKLAVASQYNLTHFIDDMPGTCVQMQQAGIKAYLFAQPHNKKVAGYKIGEEQHWITRIDRLGELYNTFWGWYARQYRSEITEDLANVIEFPKATAPCKNCGKAFDVFASVCPHCYPDLRSPQVAPAEHTTGWAERTYGGCCTARYRCTLHRQPPTDARPRGKCMIPNCICTGPHFKHEYEKPTLHSTSAMGPSELISKSLDKAYERLAKESPAPVGENSNATVSETDLRDGYKADAGKPRYDLLPWEAVEEVAKVYTYGAMKYDDNNWRKGMRYGRVFAATLRHLTAFAMGEDFDKETGLPHTAHAAFGCLTLTSYLLGNKGNLGFDDRAKVRDN